MDALRAEAAIRGKEWLQAELEGKDTDELRKLSSVAKLPTRVAVFKTMLSKAELVGQLLKALAANPETRWHVAM